MTGFDANPSQLEVARERAREAGVELELREADFNGVLPFPEASFDAVVGRFAVIAAVEPVATLRELGRVLSPGGRLVTVLWASTAENPWFAIPREAARTVLGGRGSVRAGVRAASATRKRRPRHIARPGWSRSRRDGSTSGALRPASPPTGLSWRRRTDTSGGSRRRSRRNSRATFSRSSRSASRPTARAMGSRCPRTLVIAAGQRAAG